MCLLERGFASGDAIAGCAKLRVCAACLCFSSWSPADRLAERKEGWAGLYVATYRTGLGDVRATACARVCQLLHGEWVGSWRCVAPAVLLPFDKRVPPATCTGWDQGLLGMW